VPVLASRPAAWIPGTTQVRRFRINYSHAGFPQGFINTTNLISSSIWLTNAIDRIVKEQSLGQVSFGATGTTSHINEDHFLTDVAS
jgi:hypothetical protein